MAERGPSSRPGIVLVAAGVVLVLLALVVLPWFRLTSGFFDQFFSGSGGSPTFHDVHNAVARAKQQVSAAGISPYVSFGAADAYFSWLGWILLLLAAGFGALAVSAFGAWTWTYRWIAAVVSAAAAALTVSALNLMSFSGNPPANARPPSFREYFAHSALGVWCALVGYTLILVGSLTPHHHQ